MSAEGFLKSLTSQRQFLFQTAGAKSGQGTNQSEDQSKTSGTNGQKHRWNPKGSAEICLCPRQQQIAGNTQPQDT